MNIALKFTNKNACRKIGWDRKTQADDIATGHCQFVAEVQDGFRYWDADDLTAGQFYIDGRKAGLTVKLSGIAASRLRRGMRNHPTADQLTVVTLENGSTSILPTATLDLSSGFVSGGYVATATMIDVRNLRARIQRAIDADAAIIGGDDEG
jgi:hypothetical protein